MVSFFSPSFAFWCLELLGMPFGASNGLAAPSEARAKKQMRLQLMTESSKITDQSCQEKGGFKGWKKGRGGMNHGLLVFCWKDRR